MSDIGLALGAQAIGTGLSIRSTLEQGREAEKIAMQQAAIDLENAEAAREASVEEARIKKERGVRLIAEQKGAAAAGNIRVDVGAPLVIEAETRAAIAKDIGFGLQRGRAEVRGFTSRAAISLAKGRAARKRARFSALSQGLLGFGSIAFMGAEAGLFGTKTASTAFTPLPGGAPGLKIRSGPNELGNFFA